VEPALNATFADGPLPNLCRTSAEVAAQVAWRGLALSQGCGRLRPVAVIELNGRPVTVEELRALGLGNYGHFTSMRVEDMKVRGLGLHMERLVRDSGKLFGTTVNPVYVRSLIRATAEKVSSPAIVRVTVFDSSGGLEHPGDAEDLDVLVSVREAPAIASISPLRVESVHYQRELPGVKHIGLFSSMYYRRAAQLNGFDDALFTDSRAQISEGPTWNIGFFDGKHIIWPKADMLTGVTASLLKTVVSSGGTPSIETIVQLSQVSETWAAFATNSSVGVRPIQSIDSVELLDSSSVIRNLQLQYAGITGETL
jgi:branched-subunit amino acid aminotransferase/4-amino-4-deoxychorismate lyase